MDGSLAAGWQALRQRWLFVAAFVVVVAALGPRPVPTAQIEAYQQARLAQAAGDFEAAANALEAALRIEPDQPSIRQAAARLWLRAGNPNAAQHTLAASGPARPVGDACLAFQVDWALADLAGSARLLAAKPAACPLDAGLLRQRIRLATDAGQLGSALALAEAYAGIEPDRVDALLQLGQLQAISQPASALTTLRQALEDEPAAAASVIGLIRAIEDARIDSSEAYRLAQIGQALARSGDWGLARLAFERALALEPDYIEARAYYGLALDQVGLDGRAELETARRQAPAAALPASLLGMHLLQAGEAAQAIVHLARAAELEPANPAYLAQLGAAQAAVGDLVAARESYVAAAQLSANDPNFWRLLAEFSLQHELGVAGLGLPAARRAYLLQPTPAHLDLVGYAHYLAGGYPLAARLLERAVAGAPGLASAQYHLGLVRLEAAGPSAARPPLERAQALDPQGSVGALAARTLERFDR